jgi:hypothetical protein
VIGSPIFFADFPRVVIGVFFFGGSGVFISAFRLLVFSSRSWCFFDWESRLWSLRHLFVSPPLYLDSHPIILREDNCIDVLVISEHRPSLQVPMFVSKKKSRCKILRLRKCHPRENFRVQIS